MADPIETVQEFISTINSGDVDKIMAFFADGAVYHNMPMPPAETREGIRNVIEMFVGPAETIDWEITNIAAVGSTVLTERLDRFVMGGKQVALPVMGAFAIADGRIAAWRDYFDMGTWQRQMED